MSAGMRCKAVLSFMLLSVGCLICAGLTSPQDAGLSAADSALSAAKLHPALLQRLAEEGEPVKAWVFFTDKGVATPAELDAALTEVARTYNPRAIQRRLLRGNATKRAGQVFDVHDLPVVLEYVEAVAATGARLHVVSRWVNAASVYTTRAQLEQIAMLPFVDRLEAVGRSRRIDPVEVEKPDEDPGRGDLGLGRLDYGLATNQLNQINVIALHDEGFTADGVIIGILDTGFARTHEAFNNPAHPLVVVAEYDFVNNDPNTAPEPGDPWSQHSHGTLILGTLGAYEPGDLVGGAYDASFILTKTEDITGEYPAEEDYYVAGLEFIETHGGDMATSSLGYIDWYTQGDLNGLTAVTTIGVNVATANGMHCCTAAGNSGHDSNPNTSHLIAPADAFQVIACGAVNSSGSIAGFSSDGPTADGRVKPELLARGVSTYTVDPYDNNDYRTASGTSLSTPLVAGAVACLIQAHPDWTVDQMRDGLFWTASYYVQHTTYDPLYVLGYGIVDALAPRFDCNNNGVPDMVDIANGTSLDLNGNGIPDECELGDLNCDTVIDAFDIDPFVLALTDPAGYQLAFPDCDIMHADCNQDGVIDAFDIDPFVEILTGP